MSNFAWIALQDIPRSDLPAYGKPVLVASEVEIDTDTLTHEMQYDVVVAVRSHTDSEGEHWHMTDPDETEVFGVTHYAPCPDHPAA